MKKYTLYQLEEIFERLNEIYNNFKNYHSDRLIQNVTSADGIKMSVSIPLSSVPHLLGINTDYYKSVFTTRENSADKVLEEMLDRGAYNVYSNMDIIDIDRLISPYILDKLENFVNINRINSDYIEFICHYDRKKSYETTDKLSNFDHLIVSKLENGKYSYITFSDNEYGNVIQTVPRSNQQINSEDELYKKIKDVLAKQSITIPTVVSSYDKISGIYKFKWFLPEDKKKEKALNAFKYANNLDSNLNIFNDYISSLGFSGRKTKKHKENNDILSLITLAIKKEKIITESDLNVESFDIFSEEIIALIETYNNITAVKLNENKESNSAFKFNYSKMKREIFDSKNKILELTEKLKELEMANITLSKKYSDSEEKIAKYKEKMINIGKIIGS